MEKEDVGLLRLFGGTVGELIHRAFHHDEVEATDRVERMYAFVDLMMLAILADGTLLGEELDVLEARIGEARELHLDIDEAASRIRFKAKMIDTPQKMRNRMKAAASRLPEAADRALAYQLVAELHNAGARLGSKRGGYRANLRHDDGLMNHFAEMLEIDDEDRQRLEHAPLPDSFDV